MKDFNDKVKDGQVIDSIKVKLPDIDVVAFFRLGRFVNNKCRPVKVVLRSEEQVVSIFKNTSIFKDLGLQVQNDLTRSQLSQYKSLRDELISHQNNGESNLKIIRGNGSAKIIKTKN